MFMQLDTGQGRKGRTTDVGDGVLGQLRSFDLVSLFPQDRERPVIAQQTIHRLHRKGGTIARQRVLDREEPILLGACDEIPHAIGCRHGLEAGGPVVRMVEFP